ncbi:hypothetical protein [Actinoplanes utahensis]|uniref:DUF916 domain-containing protein n=1 Tax=Actinoplanes utahensis TaxID=1869 RepID=A0A0A6UT58_ACTUT|nr:hypothetical protein [Actinoplanes utahensis]KHD77659.1 hypothetical protein MB27_09245 [Actinoplanes utahensis]GIF34642.1 hypothetical protein Aut01nite_76280 [Actinoplanes utahensis]
MRKLMALTAVLTAVLGLGTPTGVLAAPMPPAQTKTGSADFAVSTTSDRLYPDKNNEIRTVLTIANNGPRELAVEIRSVGVDPGDNGQVSFTGRPDAAWSSAVEYPSSLRLAAQAYKRVPVTLRVPPNTLPDIYLLGFVVEAQPSDPNAGIRLYHQIGALVTVEIPGASEREMEIEVDRAAFFHLGADYQHTYEVRNVGTAASLGRGQVRIDSRLTHENVGVYQSNAELQLFPAGTKRDLTYEYEVRGLFLLAEPKAQILYGNGNGIAHVAEATGQTVLIIPWPTIIGLCVLLVLLLSYWYYLRRRRAAQRRELEGQRTRFRHAARSWRPA